MALSIPVATGTVYAQFIEAITGFNNLGIPTGSTLSNVKVTFTPNLAANIIKTVSGTPYNVVVDPVKAVSDTNGNLVLSLDGTTPAPNAPIGVPLIASVNPDIDPHGWTWTVELSAQGLPTLALDFTLGVGQSLDLAHVVAVPTDFGMALEQWQSTLIEAQAAATAANASAVYAANSATVASTAATQAGISATTASSAQTAASTSATQAGTSATAAANSAMAAATSATNANTSRQGADASALAASQSQSAANASAIDATASQISATASKNAASASQVAADASATTASNAKDTAVSSATSASTSATTATTAATSATTSATTATTQAGIATAQATAATSQATIATQKAVDATTAATTATNKAQAASNSADSASASATTAGQSRDVAGTSASTASTSATNADASRAAAQTILDNFSAKVGAANGYAPLDGTGKVPASMLPSSVMEYQGTWNAATNTPTISDATADKGDFYTVVVAGTRDLGHGAIEFQPKDQLVHNGTAFEKIDNTDSVISVAGKNGAVTLVKGDVGLGNVDNTSDVNKPVSTAQQNVLNTTVNGATIVSRNLMLQQVGGGTVDAGTIVPNLTVGTTTTGAAGSAAALTLGGAAPNQTVNFTIPQGLKGDQGTQGVQGLKGDTGNTGPANTLGIGTVTSVATGTAAGATITGTAPTQTLNLTLPAGVQGLPGDLTVASQGTTSGTIDLTTVGLPSTNRYVMSGNITSITLPTTPTATQSGTITLVLVQDSTGNRTVTWPVSVLWSEGVKGQPSTAAGAISVFHLEWTGNEWLGFKAGQNFA